MTVKALRAIPSGGKVCISYIPPTANLFILITQLPIEWPRRIHPSVQEIRISLLRLGRQLQGHEVGLLKIFLDIHLSNQFSAASSSLSSRNSPPRTPRSSFPSLLDPASTPSLPATTSTAERNQSAYETYHHMKSSRSWSYYETRAERS